MPDRISLEFICALGMPPVEFVELTARLGVSKIGLAGAPFTANPWGFAPWSLIDDAALRKATGKALKDDGVSVGLGEGFLVMPGVDVSASQPWLDILAEYGAPLVNCVVIEQDQARAHDQFAKLAGMAAAHGMDLTIEFMPLMWPMTLGEAQDFVRSVGAANAGLLVDAMHFYRSGAGTSDLATIDPALIRYVQICDVPMPGTNPNYGEEARDNRLALGDGDLPLAEFLAALPGSVTVGIEAPMSASAAEGVSPDALLAPSVGYARELLAA